MVKIQMGKYISQKNKQNKARVVILILSNNGL